MKQKSLKKNAVLNSIRTILRLIFPLIAIQYVSRVLGVENVGKYSYAASIISYFLIISKLGIETFAVREGAKYRDDRNKFSKFASEVFSINILSTILSYILLVLCLIFIQQLQNYKILIIILSIEIALTTIGCEWTYTIYEDYSYITIRTIIFQVISLILLLTLVRNKNDLILYTIVMVISSSGSYILNAFNIKKYCDLSIIFNSNMKKYLVPILILFANSVTTTIYVSSDITVLGILSDDYHVGIYSTATKIYSAVKSIISSIIIVSIPRLSYLWGKKDKSSFKKVGEKILNTLITISLPMMTGLISISYEIIYIIAGKEYVLGTTALQILGAALICSLFGWFYTSCILIPAKQEKKVLFATIIAGVTNIILNIILIPYFYQDAAAFTTLLAELFSWIICYINSKKIIEIKINKKNLVSSIIGCICIWIFCFYLKRITNFNIILLTALSITGSVILYILIEVILKNTILINLLTELKNKFLKIKQNL